LFWSESVLRVPNETRRRTVRSMLRASISETMCAMSKLRGVPLICADAPVFCRRGALRFWAEAEDASANAASNTRNMGSTTTARVIFGVLVCSIRNLSYLMCNSFQPAIAGRHNSSPRRQSWATVMSPVSRAHLWRMRFILGLRTLALFEDAAQNLARSGLGNLIDDLYFANLLVRRDLLGDEVH
jgi:hypothetical protein